MIVDMNHAGLVVKDLEKSIAFYRDVIGMKVVDTRERIGGPIARILGYENCQIKIADLRLGDGGMLELIEYVHPPAGERPTEERNFEGASHLAFTVDDIEETFRFLASKGARTSNPPQEIVPGKKGCYLQDPDGNWIELVELG